MSASVITPIEDQAAGKVAILQIRTSVEIKPCSLAFIQFSKHPKLRYIIDLLALHVFTKLIIKQCHVSNEYN